VQEKEGGEEEKRQSVALLESYTTHKPCVLWMGVYSIGEQQGRAKRQLVGVQRERSGNGSGGVDCLM
jgi:hypothetical protein